MATPMLAPARQTFAPMPRPEYPQPQFQRADWLNLNGTWEFAFDDANVGEQNHWERVDHPFSREILVPFCFESPESGIGDTTFHPVVWYRRAFDAPQAWADRRVLLHFGAVDYRAQVWVNERFVGEHEGGNASFRLDITNALTEDGLNIITVRVEDPPHDRYMPRGKQHWKQQSESIFYTRTSGIWQTVWLEAVGPSYLDKVQIRTTLDGTITFDARVSRPQAGLEFHAEVRREGRVIAAGWGPVDGTKAGTGVVIRQPLHWSPGSPNLYDVLFELRQNGEVLDRVESYFGIRTIGVQDGTILLNGVPVYLKMVLDQGYWPESNLTPPSDEAIQLDIRLTKDMGFNGARKHQKVEDPRYLYWADRMGLLVSAEMANAYEFDGTAVARITREWIEVMERDLNHPSIIIWVPLNESWGVPNVADPQQPAHLRAMYHLTKSLDPTRLVIDNDGWEHTESTDLFAIHDYTKTGDVLLDRYKDFGQPGVPVPQYARLNLVPGASYNNAPLYLSEFGGVSYVHESDVEVPDNSWGYSGVEPSEKAALARMRGLYEALAKLPRIPAICYTQLTDVEQEINGLMTYDRQPKFDLQAIRRMNELLTARWP